MKKKIMFMLMIGFIAFFPVKALAMLEVDENGNPITREVKEGEVTILMAEGETTAPDEGQGSEPALVSPAPTDDNVTTSDQITVTADESVKNANDDTEKNDGRVYKTLAEDNLLVTESSKENSNDWMYIVISGITGAALGSITTYFLKK